MYKYVRAVSEILTCGELLGAGETKTSIGFKPRSDHLSLEAVVDIPMLYINARYRVKAGYIRQHLDSNLRSNKDNDSALLIFKKKR